MFYPDKVVLCPNPTFLPNCGIRISCELGIGVLHLAPDLEDLYRLDVRLVLQAYQSSKREFRKLGNLCAFLSGPSKGLEVSPRLLSAWIIKTIQLKHRVLVLIPPSKVYAHLNRVIASLWDFLGYSL